MKKYIKFSPLKAGAAPKSPVAPVILGQGEYQKPITPKILLRRGVPRLVSGLVNRIRSALYRRKWRKAGRALQKFNFAIDNLCYHESLNRSWSSLFEAMEVIDKNFSNLEKKNDNSGTEKTETKLLGK